MFIAWAAEKAGVGEYVGQFAWTPSHAVWFIKQGAWSNTPEPGALVFYDWGGGKSYKGVDHVGIVEKVEGAKIRTIEANVDRVHLKRKFRDTEKVVGYGLPRVVKEKALAGQLQPTEQPSAYAPALKTYTESPEGSTLDVLGTPQALLAGMVITTVIVSFRLAGRRRGIHRRGLRALLRWNAPTPRVTPKAAEVVRERVAAAKATLDDRLDAFFGKPDDPPPTQLKRPHREQEASGRRGKVEAGKRGRAETPSRFHEEAPAVGRAHAHSSTRRRRPYERA